MSNTHTKKKKNSFFFHYKSVYGTPKKKENALKRLSCCNRCTASVWECVPRRCFHNLGSLTSMLRGQKWRKWRYSRLAGSALNTSSSVSSARLGQYLSNLRDYSGKNMQRKCNKRRAGPDAYTERLPEVDANRQEVK